MKKKFSFILCLFVIIFSVSCDNKELKKIEIADTPMSRERGYMEREVIPFGTGMLFVFEKSQLLSFWMKNTPHPLSIAFIDSKGIIQNIYDMTPYSESNWSSTTFVKYALEVPQGWFDQTGVKVGDKVLLPNKF